MPLKIVGDTDLSPTQTARQTPAQQSSALGSAKFDSLVGARLAERYDIVRRIGEGGMGAVYEAQHSIIGKRVAIKVLLEKFVENEELMARLLQEARLASSIGHQNIVDVTDFGTTRDGRAFVVMEFLDGEPLSELVMRDAPLPVERSLRIVKQVASALGAAHDKGIVHRDVKPENVYLVRRDEQDFVKVVDFGVSKAVRSREEAGSEWQRLTRTGAVLGTPLFMSPEQAAGEEDIDERADIWATALILYECLTGELPFRGNNYLGVISQIRNKEVQAPSALRPELGIPPAVDRVVMRGLEKERTRRYQKMAALEHDIDRLLAGDLDAFFGEDAALAAPAPARRRWPLLLWVAAVLALGIATATLLARTGEETARPAAPAPARAAPRASAPAPRPVEPEPPLPSSEESTTPSRERARRSGRGHAVRPAAPVEAPSPAQKSKADDKIAPSPYTAP
ncbi:MAG: serine/threonine protein kinase [Deltaproteobacteria bacterium]|nr:serine/threonine protein kinase [Deltaproteobacteria bacterium]